MHPRPGGGQREIIGSDKALDVLARVSPCTSGRPLEVQGGAHGRKKSETRNKGLPFVLLVQGCHC